MPLTDTQVRTATAADRPRKLTDERGLFLLVNPNGSKLWRLKYRIEGREKLLALGAYPDVTLRKARDRRDEARKLLADGIDPSAERKREREAASGADTFGALAEEWFEHTRHTWTEGHAVTVRSRLDRDVLPFMAKRPIAAIQAPDVLEVLRRVEARGAIESAHRIRTICNQVFAHGIATGRASMNPAAMLPAKALRQPVARPMAALLKPADFATLLQQIEAYAGTPVVRAAFRLAPLVFVRPGELRAAEWSEIDLAGARWIIAPERMKLAKANKADAARSHIVPLSRQAVDILRDLQPLTGRGRFVFPSARGQARPMSEAALTAALRALGYTGEQMHWHGFRSIASTMLNEAGYNPDAIEAQLAHVPASKVRAAYNRAAYLPEREAMMQAWADYCDRLKAGDVEPMPRAQP